MKFLEHLNKLPKYLNTLLEYLDACLHSSVHKQASPLLEPCHLGDRKNVRKNVQREADRGLKNLAKMKRISLSKLLKIYSPESILPLKIGELYSCSSSSNSTGSARCLFIRKTLGMLNLVFS